MDTVFTKIIKGEIPSYKVTEDKNFYAFLDINPLKKGHTLVIPKKQVDYVFDLDDELYKDFFLFAKRVAKAIKKAYPCIKVGMAVIGLEVPHAHIHLVPMDEMGDLQFSNPKLQFTKEEFLEIASNIASAMEIE
jgi:histidine triad (HIT) family protein